MPRYRFSWDAFDDRTVEALACAEGYAQPPAANEHRAFLDARVGRPDEDFIRHRKATLAGFWIPAYEGRLAVVARLREAGLGSSGHPRTPEGCGEYVAKTRNTRTLRRILLEAVLRFGDRDRNERDAEADSYIPRFALGSARQGGVRRHRVIVV